MLTNCSPSCNRYWPWTNLFLGQIACIAPYEKYFPSSDKLEISMCPTVASEINILMQLGRHSYAASKATELQTMVKSFHQHWSRACGKILADHNRLENYICNGYSVHSLLYTWCDTNNIGGQMCRVKTNCVDEEVSYADAEALMRTIRSAFHKNRRRNLLTYTASRNFTN